MRVIVLGGTWFVGRSITEAPTAAGHAVLVVHRGISEPTGFPDVTHLHAERSVWPARRDAFASFGPDAAIDVSAGNGAGARAALPPGCQLVVLSSVDVHRAYEALHSGTVTDAAPLQKSRRCELADISTGRSGKTWKSRRPTARRRRRSCG